VHAAKLKRWLQAAEVVMVVAAAVAVVVAAAVAAAAGNHSPVNLQRCFTFPPGSNARGILLLAR
jgi:1,4-dihydroxy-2-naphthoate octaprenyltransferase